MKLRRMSVADAVDYELPVAISGQAGLFGKRG
jgi:hypothetical protein